MIKKEYNNILDFLEDSSFKNWAEQNNATDINYWEYWIANNPEKQELVTKAKDLALGLSFNKDFVSSDKVNLEWTKFETKIKNKKTVSKRKLRYLKPLSIAASIALLITFGFYFFTQNTKIIHKTSYGEILNIKLLDGSNVTLNSNSSLSYYKNESRKVWLKGEAFFQVDKKLATNAKFWVLTNDLSVEVYGTSFNVNSNKEKTAVFLQEGSVWLDFKNGGDKKMVPGNYISYSSVKSEILESKNITNAILQTSWKDGTLLFENLSLEKAMSIIEQTYGYAIVFKDLESKNTIITGAVPNTNLDICIKAIEKSVDVKIIKKENKLIISKK
ncbi:MULTISPECIES: FecR family protein [Tenacibaculum]|uniref:FecR family protein n=1 Tax=Tenacibaculum TaxID=104267 RepID=UPI001F0B4546|nr:MULTISPECIES: FecR family protein [Tenacibaculum]MCH3882140.1 FecR family protein [Tenacibaculum aquimarinum]MCH3885155.1 FecR family protein [Tenacibaculum aquimarinum]MDO6599780.1 FecR domain-containing protein [Tenacibaculum sp. 1_MG-2023]